MDKKIKGFIFDLDGVIVDTAKYHALAWKEIARQQGMYMDDEINEMLKGVSRIHSLEIILAQNHRTVGDGEKQKICEEKNRRYMEYIQTLTPEELLPGVRTFLKEAKEQGYVIALGSASKNAGFILERLRVNPLFDVVVDGNSITKAKPDPEVFIKAAEGLQLMKEQLIVFEDSVAGIEAAHRAHMYAIGIGEKDVLYAADAIISDFTGICPEMVSSAEMLL